MSRAKDTLQKYLPENSIELVFKLLKAYPVQLNIKTPRKTKLGDYRLPDKHGRHRISINNNLNPYAFLVTLIHEIAHLVAFEDFGRNIKPHGEEWQQTFRELAQPFFEAQIFPEDIKKAFYSSLSKGHASSCTDLNLHRVLSSYDEGNTKKTLLENLPEGAIFAIDKKRVFRKGKLLRKRFLCEDVATKQLFRVHRLAEVIYVEQKETKSA